MIRRDSQSTGATRTTLVRLSGQHGLQKAKRCGGHRESCSTEPELSASEGIRSSLTLLTKSGRATTCKLLAWRRSTLAESFNANSENRSGRRKLRSLSLHIEQVVLRTPTGFIAGEERKTNRGRPRIPSRDRFRPYSCPCLSQQ